MPSCCMNRRAYYIIMRIAFFSKAFFGGVGMGLHSQCSGITPGDGVIQIKGS